MYRLKARVETLHHTPATVVNARTEGKDKIWKMKKTNNAPKVKAFRALFYASGSINGFIFHRQTIRQKNL